MVERRDAEVEVAARGLVVARTARQGLALAEGLSTNGFALQPPLVANDPDPERVVAAGDDAQPTDRLDRAGDPLRHQPPASVRRCSACFGLLAPLPPASLGRALRTTTAHRQPGVRVDLE